MAKPGKRNKVLHVYMTEEEYAFLKICADGLDLSLAQALLHMADLDARRKEYTEEKQKNIVGGINFTLTPDQDEEVL